jgi:hypothetical protein
LGDQHAIEGIAMGSWQASRKLRMTKRDREFLKPLLSTYAADICRQHCRLRQFTDAMFRRDFPRGRGTDKDVVAAVADRVACGSR